MNVGVGGVYKGLLPTMLKQGTNQMIRFFVYSNLKSWLQEGDNTKDIGIARTFLIGGVAGAASVFGNTPVDVVKTRMQVINVILTCKVQMLSGKFFVSEFWRIGIIFLGLDSLKKQLKGKLILNFLLEKYYDSIYLNICIIHTLIVIITLIVVIPKLRRPSCKI